MKIVFKANVGSNMEYRIIHDGASVIHETINTKTKKVLRRKVVK